MRFVSSRIVVSSLLLACLAPRPSMAQQASEACSIYCLAGRAREALTAGRLHDYLEFARTAAEWAPGHPIGPYAVARGHALLGQRDSALAWLKHLADIGATHDVAMDSAFVGFRSLPAFQALERAFERNREPILSGRSAFALQNPDLIPEGMAWDPIRQTWLMGSQAKRGIFRLSTDGVPTEFISDSTILRVLGVHTDAPRDHLWFASWEATPSLNPPTGAGRLSRSRLFKAQLSTGRILKYYELESPDRSHFLNDLVITPSGDVYVTDTRTGGIYRVTTTGDSLEAFAQPDPNLFSGANGVTMADNGRTIYVAYNEGVARVDLETRRLERLSTQPGISDAALDGLYWYRGGLIGVQIAGGLVRVMRYHLSTSGEEIVGAEILERSMDKLRLPTTGVILDDKFYYIANSQADRLDSDSRLRPAQDSPPTLTVVRVIDLK